MEQKHKLIEMWKKTFDFNDKELKAFSEVERFRFVPKQLKHLAYYDAPLPLLRGKTISQPTTVMIMTSALELKQGERVFEIGTGSGYQSAIIARIIGSKGKVITTEVIPELVIIARENLKKSGIANVEVYEEDGSHGMQKEAPFDKIIITAACKDFPDPLVNQLKTNGIIIGPIGNQQEQQMVRGIKRSDGSLDLEFLGSFLFTPLYGKYGFEV